jgi:phage recombination protein Bet
MTEIKTKPKATEASVQMAEEASAGAVAKFNTVRLPYHPAFEERFGVNLGAWKVLVEAIWPAAATVDSVAMALAYCKARNLDPFKRVVHIVPMWSKAAGGMVETVWPGIAELRTTAFRTGDYAGCDEPAFGPMIERTFKDNKGNVATVKFPEWCRITVHRVIKGVPCKFVGPKTVWTETYATVRNDSEVPNSMWESRPEGQIEKCAEAAALRRAFPEELGSVYAAEEMEGRIAGGDIHGVPIPKIEPPSPPPAPPAAPKVLDGEIVPPKAQVAPTASPKAPYPPKVKVEEAVWEPEFPGYKDLPNFYAWVDAMLNTVPVNMGIDALETFFNAKIDQHLSEIYPTDRDEVLGIYEKHRARFEPA